MSRIVQSRAVVIRRMNYRESSMIVDLFTESHGLAGFIVSGVRKTKPVMSPVLFTPGYLLSVVFYEREPHHLWRIKEASMEHQLHRTPFDIVRGNTALCMSEVIKKTVHPHDAHTPLYPFFENYFLTLDRVEKSANLFLHFLTHLAVEMGFGPKGGSLKEVVYFDMVSGEFLNHEPVHPMVMKPAISALLLAILDADLKDMGSFVINRVDRQTLTDDLIDYVRYHSHTRQPIRSYELLKRIW